MTQELKSAQKHLVFPASTRERETLIQSFEGLLLSKEVSPGLCESVQVNTSEDLCSEHSGEAGTLHSPAGNLRRLVLTLTRSAEAVTD